MNQIFTVLSEWNKFHHFKLNGNAMRKHGDRMKGFSDEGLFRFFQGSPWRKRANSYGAKERKHKLKQKKLI